MSYFSGDRDAFIEGASSKAHWLAVASPTPSTIQFALQTARPWAISRWFSKMMGSVLCMVPGCFSTEYQDRWRGTLLDAFFQAEGWIAA